MKNISIRPETLDKLAMRKNDLEIKLRRKITYDIMINIMLEKQMSVKVTGSRFVRPASIIHL